MPILFTQNSDSTSGTDRVAIGPKQDGSTPNGTTNTTGGAVTSVNGYTGAVTLNYNDVGAIGVGQNATVNLLVCNAVATFATVGYATGGSVQMRFDLGNAAYIGATTSSLSLSPSGSGGLTNGRWQNVTIKNTTGSAMTLTLNASWVVAGTLPASLSGGQVIELFFQIYGTSESDVKVGIIGAASSSGLPSGGGKFQILTKNSATNYDAGWYSAPEIYATDYAVVGDNSTDNTTALGNAIAAANAANACLVLPSGKIKFSSTLSFAPTGNMSIRGNGRKATQLIQTSSGQGGLYIDCSANSTNYTLATCNLQDLSIISGSNTCGQAVTIYYGSSVGAGGCTDTAGCVISNVEIAGGGWQNGILLNNAWNCHLSKLYICGDNGWAGGGTSNNYISGTGAGSGRGIYVTNGSTNTAISDLTTQFWRVGVALDGSSQGIQINNWGGVECINFINASGSGASVYLTNFVFDNGNIYVSSKLSVQLSGFDVAYLTGGQILQNGGANLLKASNCTKVMVESVDMSYVSGVSGAAVLLTGSTSGSIVSGCTFGGFAVQCDGSTSANIATDNTGVTEYLDSATNKLGDVQGFNQSFTLTNVGNNILTLTLPGGAFGRAPTAGIINIDGGGSIPVIIGGYMQGSSSASSALFKVYMADGTNLPAGAQVFNMTLFP